MAIDWGRVLRTNKGSAGSSYATASWTPGATKAGANFWVVVVSAWGPSTQNTPTISGNGATWTQQATQQENKGSLTIFTTANATSIGAFTADFAGQSQTDILVHILEFAGVASSGQVVQAASKQLVAAATSISQTLSAFGDSVNNLGLAAGNAFATSDPTIVAGSGWGLEGGDFEYAGNLAYNLEHTTPGTTTATQEQTASFSWTGSHLAEIVALEIKAAPAGGGGMSGGAAFYLRRRRHN